MWLKPDFPLSGRAIACVTSAFRRPGIAASSEDHAIGFAREEASQVAGRDGQAEDRGEDADCRSHEAGAVSETGAARSRLPLLCSADGYILEGAAGPVFSLLSAKSPVELQDIIASG